MKYGMIGTWKMAFEGVSKASEILKAGGNASDAVIKAVTEVEDNPDFISVGYGGLPNRNGDVELDAAFMDGDTLKFGAVVSVRNVKNPIKVARQLSRYSRNNILAGIGAEQFAAYNGYELQNMVTEKSQKRYIEKIKEGFVPEELEAYGGHDTVCVIGLDKEGHMANGVSTSGLFMKHPGRVGDSPVIGSGFYCDSLVGGASATGVGEDIMKGCLSFSIVNLMKSGTGCLEACEKVLSEHVNALLKRGINPGSMSVIAMDKDGNFGAATNKEDFPFIVCNEENETKIMVAQCTEGKMRVFEADAAWLLNYKGD